MKKNPVLSGPKVSIAAIHDIWKQFCSSLNAGDIDRWISLWADNGVQMPPNSPPIVGKRQIHIKNKEVLDRFAFNMSVTPKEIRVTGDWAFAWGIYAATLTPREGGKATTVDGKFMTILQGEDAGSWKIYCDIFNSNVEQ